jgi:hypothetical protein
MPHARIARVGFVLALMSGGAIAGGKIAPAPNGIELPADYKDWKIISVAHRTDNNTMRAIVGNEAAVTAARQGHTHPWPNGAVLGKIVWKAVIDKHWDKATVPGEFVHVEFMVKDAAKFAATGGWGYARWKGTELKPYGNDANVAQECVACHTTVKSQDYVFTRPAPLP